MKIRTELTHYVDYSDLERCVKQAYGVNLEIAASEECGNDTSLTYVIDNEPLDRDDASTLESYRAGEFPSYGATRLFLQKLCIDGKIPAGNYVIEVSW